MVIALVIYFVFVLYLLVWVHKENKDNRRLELAETFHNGLFDKICELRNDPLMTDEEWQEWLPICKFSDDLLRRCLPSFNSLEEIARREIKLNDQPNLR